MLTREIGCRGIMYHTVNIIIAQCINAPRCVIENVKIEQYVKHAQQK